MAGRRSARAVEDVSENARANLEYVDMRFGAPVYFGDTLEVESKVLGVRTSSSRPNLGDRPRADHGAEEHRRARRGDRPHVASARCRSTRTTRRSRRTPVRSPPDQDRVLALAPAVRAGPRLQAALAPFERRHVLRGLRAPATRIEHSRGRTMTSEHIALTAMLDNTTQVHCNQYMIDRDPERSTSAGS